MEKTAEGSSLVRKRSWTIGIIAISIVLASTAFGLYGIARDFYSEIQVRSLIRTSYDSQRPGGGRLGGAQYSAFVRENERSSDLGRAQVLVLGLPDSEARRELQSLVYLSSGNWKAAAESLKQLVTDNPKDASFANNLGTAFLALAESDRSYLLKALDQFEFAANIAPTMHEPRFNLVTSYRKLQLPEPAAEALKEYTKLDSNSPWNAELTSDELTDESVELDQMRTAVENKDFRRAEQLFKKNPELYRRVVMQYGFFNISESEAVVAFIADQFERHFGDKTVQAIIAPLATETRGVTYNVRNLVRQGAELYYQSKINESLATYAKADVLVDQTQSLFDHYWIAINRVDTMVRAGDFEAARDSLETIIRGAQEHEFRWLLAKAFSIYGSTIRLTSSFNQMLDFLGEAEGTFVKIGASYDAVRPLFYLAGYRYGVGDQDEALRLAFKCLDLTSKTDPIRLSSLYWLIGSILYRSGTPNRAVLFERAAVKTAQDAKNPALETTSASTVAQLYDAMGDRASAENYLKIAEDAFQRTPSGLEQARAELFLNMVKARIYLNQKRYTDTESVLERNLLIYPSQPFQATYVRSRSLMLLGLVQSETGRIEDAARSFEEAIDVVESDDRYLQSEKLRVKFDDERRELYDSGISFEYDHGSPDAAWSYVQKYRAKLFLEFLASFNPDIIRLQALDRSTAQKLIPSDVQVVEYVSLSDRLLIWYTSDKVFTSRSVPVSRADLEAKVQEILAKLRASADVDALSADLAKVLIEPIADLLDKERTIAIIPDRSLHGLPFAALRRSGTNEYLVQQYAVITSPSLTHLLATNAERPSRSAIVGFGSQTDDTSGSRELAALKDIYQTVTTRRGRQVDKATFLAAMNTAPIFHYAGHSATDAVDPLRSSILLDGNRYGPNSVTAVDISQQRLFNNAVVVLSSCDSSVGNSRDGVGMRGLTSAFLIGGAGSVVGSLWPVEASSTSELMIRFHQAFGTSQMPVAHALRKAQITFLESYPERAHPYYWSGFVVTGNFSALR